MKTTSCYAAETDGESSLSNNVIFGINGPVVTVRDTRDFTMLEMVYVGRDRLIGEVIGITDALTTIQVYEETTGLIPGEPVAPTGRPLSAQLGPGLLSGIFDGIERPLQEVEKRSGAFIGRGILVSALDEEKKWDVAVKLKAGEQVAPGEVYATCPETPLILHKCMIPEGLSGEVVEAAPDGQYAVNDQIAVVKDKKGVLHPLTLCQSWPIRQARGCQRRVPNSRPLVTGQRIIDTLFPIAKGGAAAIPGGFGTGKTMTQHQLAKWCDADIIVYVGCGERGNEMTQVLHAFGELIDPKTGRPLTDRTILIANSSNMPVAAREASIYTGITLAEYYRDMGYHVAMMADSTSRWAEALREISGRLEEMPAEEGFPAYLSSRLSEFYERAGYVETLGGDEGSVTVIGAVSPQGGDFSEPVTQNTKRFIRCFWALDRQLAYARHYPAINWITSYTEYMPELEGWYTARVGKDFLEYRRRFISILGEEGQLMEIVKLIGADILPDDQKLVIETARLIRVGFLQQNAFHAVDTYVPLEKQFLMMKTILHLYDRGRELVSASVPFSELMATGLFDKLSRIKYDVSNDEPQKLMGYTRDIDAAVDDIRSKNAMGKVSPSV